MAINAIKWPLNSYLTFNIFLKSLLKIMLGIITSKKFVCVYGLLIQIVKIQEKNFRIKKFGNYQNVGNFILILILFLIF